MRPKPKAGKRGTAESPVGRKALGWDSHMPFSLERKLQVPPDAPPRLLEDIHAYSAFVDMQSKMAGTSSWYQKLT